MDLKKIGKYIAEKRKALGLTQLQLAEKLGMSNKSVSKWERGICLPDVTVYPKLCDALNISLNEFLAGEDLLEVEMIPKSEENLIGFAKANKLGKEKSVRTIVLLLIILLMVLAGLIYFLQKDGAFYNNCIVPLTWDSSESKAAELVWEGGATLFKYYADTEYNHMQIRYHWYKDGKLTDEGVLRSYEFSGDHYGEGMIAIIDDYDNGSLDINISLDGKEYEYGTDDYVCDEFKLPLEGQKLDEWQADHCYFLQPLQKKMKLDENGEAGLLVMSYDKDGNYELAESIEKKYFLLQDKSYCPEIEENDYTAFITVKFSK